MEGTSPGFGEPAAGNLAGVRQGSDTRSDRGRRRLAAPNLPDRGVGGITGSAHSGKGHATVSALPNGKALKSHTLDLNAVPRMCRSSRFRIWLLSDPACLSS